MKSRFSVAFVAGSTLAVACAAQLATADATLQFSDTGDEPHTIMVKDARVAMESGGGEVMLYDKATRQVTVVDRNSATYYVLDLATMKQRMQAVQGQMQQMQSQMAPMMEEMRKEMEAVLNDPNLSDQQKQMIEQQMAQMEKSMGAGSSAGGGRAPTFSTRATGASRTLSGVKCAAYVIYQDDRPAHELCVAAPGDLGVSNSDYNTVRDMFAFMREMSRQMMEAIGQQGGPDETSFPDVEGLPVEMKDLEDGSISRLQSVSTDSIDASIFTVPANFRQSDPFGGG